MVFFSPFKQQKKIELIYMWILLGELPVWWFLIDCCVRAAVMKVMCSSMYRRLQYEVRVWCFIYLYQLFFIVWMVAVFDCVYFCLYTVSPLWILYSFTFFFSPSSHWNIHNSIRLCQAQLLREFFFFLSFFRWSGLIVYKTVLWMWGTLLCCCPMIMWINFSLLLRYVLATYIFTCETGLK